MVGFGSSLRISRRKGWESSYLDYESLKLLLTHIEAVYEETRHVKNHPGGGGFRSQVGTVGSGGGGDSSLGNAQFIFFDDGVEGGQHPMDLTLAGSSESLRGLHEGGSRRKTKGRLDYRKELFLESDSDHAYASVNDAGRGGESDLESAVGDVGVIENRDVPTGTIGAEERSMPHGGTRYGKFNAEGREYDVHITHPTQGSDTWREKQELRPSYGTVQDPGIDERAADGEDNSYLTDTSGGHAGDNENDDYFYVDGERSHDEFTDDEMTGLLDKDQAREDKEGENSNFFSLFYLKKKEQARRYREMHEHQVRNQDQQAQAGTLNNFGRSVMVGGIGGGSSGISDSAGNNLAAGHHRSGPGKRMSVTGRAAAMGRDMSRSRGTTGGDKKTRGKRRVRKRIKKKNVKRTKVPIHILIAHSKARAITERFLGLLRAEVEKVTLFSHSRMGELADTIGCLRFPTYDDASMDNASFGEYPLSDGGMHPSGSSSSDSMGDSWSDSSNEKAARDMLAMDMQRHAPASSDRRRRSRPTTTGSNEGRKDRRGVRGRGANASTRGVPQQNLSNDHQDDLVVRQIQHGEQLRTARPTFQRAEHVLDDDFLLLSAVDEADAFAAVGVELMHLLRYICVNTIAVRKICKKHDRLLANRMLGGYYHRLREQRKINEKNFKKLGLRTGHGRFRGHNKSLLAWQKQEGLSGLDGGASDGQAPLLGRMFASSTGNELEGNLDKITGVVDVRVQELANSSTIEMISSVLAFALAEYEISENRATALSKVDAAPTLRQARHSAHSLVSLEAADDTEGLCYQLPFPSTSFGLTSSPTKAPAISSARAFGKGNSMEAAPSHEYDSTSSNMSLTRLKFVTASIYGLREAARPKMNYFRGFLARHACTFTGSNVVGDGLDGCSRETLDFFVNYDPDIALMAYCNTLYESLQKGKSKGTVCGIFTSSLAAATALSSRENGGRVASDYYVQNALTIMPVPSDYDYLESGLSNTLKGWKATVADGDVIVQRGTVRLNRISMFLYTMNYWIIAPSTYSYTLVLGENAAHSGMLVGVANVSSFLGAVLHSYMLSKDNMASKLPSAGPFFFRLPLILCAMSALAGNIIYADASRNSSLLMAYLGRFLIGFGAADVLNCNLISKCVPPAGLVSESAKLVKASMLGFFMGPLFGTLLSIGENQFTMPDGQEMITSARSVSTPGYFMAGLWFLQILGLLCFFQEPIKKAQKNISNPKSESEEKTLPVSNKEGSSNKSSVAITPSPPNVSGFVSDSDSSSNGSRKNDGPTDRRDLLYRTLSDTTQEDLETAYGAVTSPETTGMREEDEYSLSNIIKKHPHKRPFLSSINRARKLIFHNVALPATIAILAFATFAQETMLNSCALVTHRYFGWNSPLAGLWLTVLGTLVLPTNYIIESISRYREERIVMKLGLMAIGVGLLVLLNYENLLDLLLHLRDNFSHGAAEYEHPNTYYDKSLGFIQYLFGSLIVVVGIISLEGSTLSLISKVAPSKLERSVLNLGLLVTLIRQSTRFIADVVILCVSLSHRITNADIINSLVILVAVMCCAVYHFGVKRHFYFLL